MERFRWGILSTGNIAHHFAKTLNAMKEEAQIYAVASRSSERAAAFAEEAGAVKAYGSYEELAADENIDAVYIGTPHTQHFEDIMLCLEHGKNVLCEKSFTVTAEEAEKAYAKAEEKGVFLMEAFWTKFIPVYEDLEEILRRGDIGRVNMVTAQYGYCTPRAKRKFDPSLAGGALLDIGVYSIGFACMILGYDPVRISSQVLRNDVGTDAISAVTMQYEDGAIAQVSAAIQTTMPVLGMIYGSEGRIEVPDFKNPHKIRIVLNDGSVQEIEKPLDINGFEYEIREVQRCVREGRTKSGRMTPQQSVAVMKIMDEARRQWKEN